MIAANQKPHLLAIIEASTVTGPAKNLLEFCLKMRQWGAMDVSVATFTGATFTGQSENGKPTEFAAALDREGIPLTQLRQSNPYDPRIIKGLRALMEQTGATIVQTHAVKSHSWIYLSRVWRKRPWVAFHHGYTTTDLKMRVYNQVDRLSLRAPKQVVTVSRAFEQQLVERGVERSKIAVLQNAVDPEWADRVKALDRMAMRARLGIAPEERVLLAIGRMSQEKAHIDLMEAYRRIRGAGVAARLILVGDGPERQRLEQAADENVIFAGQVRDTAPYYAAADVMVLSSLTEGSPNVLLEAMATGVPSVATCVGGVPEIVRNREGALLVPPSNPEALADAIREVLSDAALRESMAARAEAIIRANHSPDARAQRLLDMYRTIRL